MISNGDPAHAVRHGAHRADPPAPGCTRAGTCGALHEDALTYSDSGLALAPGLVVDTHFSERARELRLIELLAATGHARGIGVDETSALHLRWGAEGLVLSAVGAHGGWAIDASEPCDGTRRSARMHYLAPGAAWRWDADGALVAIDPLPALANRTVHGKPPASALAGGALREAAGILARGSDTVALAAGEQHVRLTRSPSTRAWRSGADPAAAGVTDLRLELSEAHSCRAP